MTQNKQIEADNKSINTKNEAPHVTADSDAWDSHVGYYS